MEKYTGRWSVRAQEKHGGVRSMHLLSIASRGDVVHNSVFPFQSLSLAKTLKTNIYID